MIEAFQSDVEIALHWTDTTASRSNADVSSWAATS